MKFVIVEKRDNSAPTETQLQTAITAVGGEPGEVTGNNARRTIYFKGDVDHNNFENYLIKHIERARSTSWNFIWGDTTLLKLTTLAAKQNLSQGDYHHLFSTLLDTVSKSVKIQIAPNDLATLKQSKYKLCFAKKVGDHNYNVVWQAYDKFLSSNTFSWIPIYQLFGTNSFNSGVKVDVATNLVPIQLGETSTLDSNGNLQEAITGGPDTGFTLYNEYGSIHPGIRQLSTGINGERVSTPIYASTDPIVTGECLLTPVEKVLVWFEQDVITSTMFSTSRSKSIEIDLTETNSAVRLYSNGVWSTPK